ncbi:DUF3021 domain-containing protein [Staphylococcus simulans]|uniref:DUF3021 domain-containing protein n=1 Tax=Staphylococcus simulans TaxID=1286 RepID=UPI000E6A8224|nr:DUF3021 domain-containing protein [Staphylococcus simulans]MEB6838005.1 DUF3021 domain-containing protein [Staphylococcus simulans]RIN42207.1 DUF3021 domain-containing protein [Staphylococcus simulans]
MKHIIKQLCIGFMAGITIGITISLIFSFIFAQGQYESLSPVSTMGIYYRTHLSEVMTMFVCVIIWGLIGVLFTFAKIIYYKTDWSLLKTTLVHLVLCYVGFLPLAMLAGWFPLDLLNIIIFTLIFLFIYSMIWIINYIKNKRLVNEINHKLK